MSVTVRGSIDGGLADYKSMAQRTYERDGGSIIGPRANRISDRSGDANSSLMKGISDGPANVNGSSNGVSPADDMPYSAKAQIGYRKCLADPSLGRRQNPGSVRVFAYLPLWSSTNYMKVLSATRPICYLCPMGPEIIAIARDDGWSIRSPFHHATYMLHTSVTILGNTHTLSPPVAFAETKSTGSTILGYIRRVLGPSVVLSDSTVMGGRVYS
ncbi:uncharacterized protein F5891DRAFT_985923 [Suillus fuscotomentosus]|jgi:hypothetical protein|uniref:Uncharacterized protein n=2 Tax=Suillus fuscotomentosus TaxID=1912939 RepID=A0AAD4HDB0_9AGAM|nr:uncharacterized protein F5891DRAFT_985923 [Suillus fuscotomentosus]KAG1893415.1 hypothetical protein F5891DRAFT_985923 [Suillus fuscotomentosus]